MPYHKRAKTLKSGWVGGIRVALKKQDLVCEGFKFFKLCGIANPKSRRSYLNRAKSVIPAVAKKIRSQFILRDRENGNFTLAQSITI